MAKNEDSPGGFTISYTGQSLTGDARRVYFRRTSRFAFALGALMATMTCFMLLVAPKPIRYRAIVGERLSEQRSKGAGRNLQVLEPQGVVASSISEASYQNVTVYLKDPPTVEVYCESGSKPQCFSDPSELTSPLWVGILGGIALMFFSRYWGRLADKPPVPVDFSKFI